ncbi:putative E3 ubiquitin-protein ligase LIN isoform X2 [Cucumis melo]|uniref:RING-type E3 ubiquitin transferase n=1 Tax=Cucumis melo TaxID=3656 RepID=A0A1S3BRV1_CUCME|nr:putative E3 ubiquitin-protein ligase LIN isoform X2 [Cucumis melo]
MASSLEELLAEEGFRGRRPIRKSKGPFNSHTTSTSNNDSQDKRNLDSDLGGQVRTTMKPSLLRHSSDGDFHSRGIMKSLTEGGTFTYREKRDKKSSKQYVEGFDGKRHVNVTEQKPCLTNLAKDKTQRRHRYISEDENENFKGIYSNKVHVRHGVKSVAKEKELYKERWSGKNIDVEKRQRNSLKKNLFGRINFHHCNETAVYLPERSYDKSKTNASTRNWKNFEDDHSQTHDNFEDDHSQTHDTFEDDRSQTHDTFEDDRSQTHDTFEDDRSQTHDTFEDDHSQTQDTFVDLVSLPALDEVAVQAVVSIINGHLKYFLKDKDFRLMLRQNTFNPLNFIGVEECNSSKVVATLEQAIDVVEKAAEGFSTEKNLKKALLQLSMIAGLNTNALKDGFTFGISNSKLSACAHLYLGIIFKIQNKKRSSAKHILQVFCNLTFQARIVLFPKLWDDLFLPHLLHIKSWYDYEADSLVNAPKQSRKQKLLDKVYNETLDSGTCKYAVYYKDWLTGIEAPEPSIVVPAVSFEGVDQESPVNNSTATTLCNDFVSPNLMVSKKLYDAMFATSKNQAAPHTEIEWELENLDNCVRSSNSSNVSKHTQIYYSDTTKDLDQDTDADSMGSTTENTSSSENCKAQEWKTYNINALSEMDGSDEFCSSTTWKNNEIDFEVLHAQSNTDGNSYSRQKLAQPSHEPIKVNPSLREPNDSYESSDEISSVFSLPKDFICPLTGQLYQDPVTLETGQSFEKTAIKAWLDQGHRTCPVTGKKLETLAIPLTNFILQRVIKNWNSNRRRNFLAFLSQRVHSSEKSMTNNKSETTIFILDQFLTAGGKVEAMENANYLIANGYLRFLIQLFESGNLEEKTRVLALLSRCIQADEQCRNQIADEISISSLVNLLHSKQVKSLESVVQLLTKLIFLKRRKDVTLFLSRLLKEDSEDTLQAILVYLRSSPPVQRPLVAVLLLHFNLVVESLQQSMYMEEALDAIIKALDASLTNQKIRESCCEAILILGGHFPLRETFGSMTLKEVGFINFCEVDSIDYKEENPEMNNKKLVEDEKQAIEEWRRKLTLSLMKSVKQPFFEIISKCLAIGSLDLVGVGLSTLTWLSFSLPRLPAPKFHPLTLSDLISLLKACLQNSMLVEHKILASTCLLNLSKIAECRLIVIAIRKEIEDPLRSIAEISQSAKHLYAIITRRENI